MRRAIQLLSILGLLSSAFAGAPDSIWTRKYGGSSWDNAAGGLPDLSGGFVLVGQTQSFGPAGQNGYMVRTNAIGGDTVFTKWYGGSATDVLYDVHVTAGRMLAVGTTYSYGSNPPNAWLVCTNALGDTVWTRTIDLGGNESALAVDHGSDYFVAGSAWPVGGQPHLLVAKVSDAGSVVWTSTLGGTQIDNAFDVLALSDGGCMVAGETYNFGIGAPPFSNAWLVRFDSNGDTVWTKTYGDSGTYEGANAIITTADGGFALVGYQGPFTGNRDVYLIKTDADGNLEWSRTYGGPDEESGLDLVSPCDDGYFIGGYTESYGAGDKDAFLIRTAANGDTVWTAAYGGTASDICYAVSHICGPFYNAGYYAAGSTQSGSAGPQDAWLIRLDGEPLITITHPLPCQQLVIGSTMTITWFNQGTTAFPYVSVELNRDYPSGAWDTLSASTYDVGFAQYPVTAPASPNCRVRVRKLAGSPAEGISPANFPIVPTGTLQPPVLQWDSTYNGGAMLRDVIRTADGNYATPYGSSIVKRDTLGAEIWTASFPYSSPYVVESFAITELSNGDFVAAGTLDTIVTTYLTIMRCDAAGTPLSTNNGWSFNGWFTVGRDIVSDAAGDGYWALATVSVGNSVPGAAVLREPAGGGSWWLLLDTPNFDPLTCALADNDGLLIAGMIGDASLNGVDIYLASINGDGDTLWTRRYDFGVNDVVSEIRRLVSGDYVIGAVTYDINNGASDLELVIVNSAGDVLQSWTQDLSYTDNVGGVIEDADGGIVVAGSSAPLGGASDARLIKFGCDGSLLWNLYQGGVHNDFYAALDRTADGGFIASGFTTVASGGGGFATRPRLAKYGPQTWTPPPTCSTADSLVVKYNPLIPGNVLSWKGTDQGVYFIFSNANYDTASGGWSQIGCVQPNPPERSSFSFTDTNLSPARKFYRVVHDCNGSCGGGGE